MIALQGKNVKAMCVGRSNILAAYMHGHLIWPEEIINNILSCYYNGYWIDDYPWTEDTPWKD